METGQERVTLAGHTGWVSCCSISPDGRFVVSGARGFDRTLKIWDMKTGQERITLAGHTDAVSCCSISPDGRFVVSGSDDKTLKVWDVETGEACLTLPLPGKMNALSVHPQVPLCVCGDNGGNVIIVDLVGITYGPLIVTAVNSGARTVIHCPFCLHRLPLKKKWLGQVITCPRRGCEGRMRVSPFIIRMPSGPRYLWWKLRWRLLSLGLTASSIKKLWVSISIWLSNAIQTNKSIQLLFVILVLPFLAALLIVVRLLDAVSWMGRVFVRKKK